MFVCVFRAGPLRQFAAFARSAASAIAETVATPVATTGGFTLNNAHFSSGDVDVSKTMTCQLVLLETEAAPWGPRSLTLASSARLMDRDPTEVAAVRMQKILLGSEMRDSIASDD